MPPLLFQRRVVISRNQGGNIVSVSFFECVSLDFSFRDTSCCSTRSLLGPRSLGFISLVEILIDSPHGPGLQIFLSAKVVANHLSLQDCPHRNAPIARDIKKT
jgi:hypothetical protein